MAIKRILNSISQTISRSISFCISSCIAFFLKFITAIDSIQFKNPYLRLLRIHKPLPYLLQGLPIFWLLTGISNILSTFDKILYWFIAFIGVFCARSAGCIINDIIDRNIDTNVERTKLRPLASRELTVRQALLVLLGFCAAMLILLCFFSTTSIYCALIAALLSICYPYCKQFTGYAQVVLGLTFNAGVLIFGFTVIPSATAAVIVLYLASAFWTIGYDSVYALQDIKDDRKLQLHSLATKFEASILNVVTAAYNLFLLFMVFFALLIGLHYIFFIFVIIVYYVLRQQMQEIDPNSQSSLDKNFPIHLSCGLLLWFGILLSS